MEQPGTRKDVERLIRAEGALERIGDTRPRWLITPHKNGQLQFLQSRHKIRVAIPGNGWGKTTTMAVALDMAIQKDDPYNPDLLPRHPVVAIWVCQKFQQMDILRHQLELEVWTRPWTWNQSKHRYTWPNGGELHIVSADSDWEHIQGIPVDYVCFDEHPDKKLWTEFMFRRRGRRKTRYMIAATMTTGMTWFVREVIQTWERHHKEKGLTGYQAREQQLHPHIWVWDKGGIRDNPCMDAADVDHYLSIGHASDKELKVRLEGGYADFAGDSVFDTDALDRQLANLKDGNTGALVLSDPYESHIELPKGLDKDAILIGRLGGKNAKHYCKWMAGEPIDGGQIDLWELPKIDSTYVIGADFAAGLIGRDLDYAVVLKKNEDGTCEQVAEARGWWGDNQFAEILYSLGLWYFNAFIVGERQFGLPCLRRLYDEWGYGHIYRGRIESTRSRRPSDLLGHHRSSGDTIIPNLRAAVLRDHLVIRSRELIEQLRQYQYRPRSSTVDPDDAKSDQLVSSAPSGMNDDGVMALAYAWHACREVTKFVMPAPEYAPGTYGKIFDNDRVLRGMKPRGEPRPRLYF